MFCPFFDAFCDFSLTIRCDLLFNCGTEESNYKGVFVGVVSKSISLCGAVGINSATPLYVLGCSCGEPDQEAGPD